MNSIKQRGQGRTTLRIVERSMKLKRSQTMIASFLVKYYFQSTTYQSYYSNRIARLSGMSVKDLWVCRANTSLHRSMGMSC